MPALDACWVGICTSGEKKYEMNSDLVTSLSTGP